MNPEDFLKDLKKGTKSGFISGKRAALTVSISILFFILIALSTSIGYSTQMFSAGIEYWLPAISFTVTGLYFNGGLTEIILNLVYSVLIGIIATNTFIQFRNTGIRARNFSGIAPGFLIAGCTGCGIGLLSLAGLTGVVAVLPFQGTLIKLAGIILLIYFIADIGKPELCTIPS
ncbi:MAG: hypothetical protein BRC27_02370 [Nanohaloarchaea archaeon SW_10_44_10]|nr:MAG: hypothetical protein BRC27_02370 [Nanohaloarchaea archaeon SW_10_44_10]